MGHIWYHFPDSTVIWGEGATNEPPPLSTPPFTGAAFCSELGLSFPSCPGRQALPRLLGKWPPRGCFWMARSWPSGRCAQTAPAAPTVSAAPGSQRLWGLLIYKALYVPAVNIAGSKAMINEALAVRLMDLHIRKAYTPFPLGWPKEDSGQAHMEDVGAWVLTHGPGQRYQRPSRPTPPSPPPVNANSRV